MKDEELDAEIQSHLDLLTADHVRRGLSAQEAREAARREFGGVEQMKETYRDQRGGRWLDDLVQDVRYASRTLLRAPGFTPVVVMTLALGIGANTAIFSVVNAVLLQPLPYRGADRLVRIIENVPASERAGITPQRLTSMTASEVAAFRSQSQTLSHLIVYTRATAILSIRDEAIRLDGSQVSPAAFSMLGAQALIGRTFDQREEMPGADAAVLLGYSAWQRYFGGEANIVGRVLTLDQTSRSVIGVMPEGFTFPEAQTEFWIPYVLPVPTPARTPALPAMARMKDGVSIQTAAVESRTILSQLRESRNTNAGTEAPDLSRFEVVRVQDELVAPVRPALLVLAVAVGLVLLITCVNVANLLLARSSTRRQEIAVRLALGAGRGRLIRQALTESTVLALMGGVAGTALAFGGTRLLRTLGASLPRRDLVPVAGLSIPRLDEIGIDWSVLVFALALSVFTALVFGLAPAVRQVSRLQTVRRHPVPGPLVVAEMAMAMMLFVGGGLLLHSFMNLSGVDPGYDPANVLTFQVTLPPTPAVDARRAALAEDLVTRLQPVVGQRSAGYAQGLPMVQLLREGGLRTTADLPSMPPPRQSPGSANIRVVSRDFLLVMRVPLVAGRGFAENDRAGQPQVMLINQAMARSGFFEGSAVGTQVYYGAGRAPWEIVGIVEDVRQFGLDSEPGPQVFIDSRQMPASAGPALAGDRSTYFAVRTGLEPASVASSIRGIVRQLEPQATLHNVATMEQLVSNSISRPRLYAVLLGIFAAVAAVLAAIGIYGMVGYSVSQRTREIGIRMALGAQRPEVMGLVLRQSLTVSVVGIVLGLAGATALTRYLERMLFELTPLDLATFAGVSVVFALVAAFASYVPARRATKVDPVIALRYE